MRPSKLGLVLSIPFLGYVVYCIGIAIRTHDAATQVAVSVFSYPTSQILFSIAGQALDSLGPYGDPVRRVAEWSLLTMAGFSQYFSLGYLIGKVAEEMKDKRRQ